MAMRALTNLATLSSALLFYSVSIPAADRSAKPAAWADFVEPAFPFFSSVLDTRNLGPGWPTNNLTPRGLILNLGHDCWACFDTDLLRVSAIWQGRGVTPVSMAQGSYHTAGSKAPEGQEKLPRIVGTPWLANGIYPGWLLSESVSLNDPRESAPDPTEVGLGPLPRALGTFKAIVLEAGGVRLDYEVGGVGIREWVSARREGDQLVVERRFQLERVRKPMHLLLGQRPPDLQPRLNTFAAGPDAGSVGNATGVEILERPDGLRVARIQPSFGPIEFSVLTTFSPSAPALRPAPEKPAELRWPQVMKTAGSMATAKDAYVVDNLALPLTNPWQRNVRLADLAFFKDGRAAVVTFDGDVWIVEGLRDDLREVTWRRFASGLHEPLSLGIRDEQLFAFDRNGIWRLRDTDGNGEADWHELISNRFTQTAETREYANSMKLAPDGSFILAKGGQQGTTTGRQNGMVLRVSPDGQAVTELAFGLRQPFLGVHPRSGLITASDQQGHYVPATPLHVIRDHQFYGFLSTLLPKEKYPAPIAEPLTWIPHPINASGASEVWLTGAKMGSLNDSLIHLGYYRPEAFVVLRNERAASPQAAVVSLTRDFTFSPLAGAVNPVDGQLYVTGFQIWGTEAKQISGLARIRYTRVPSTLPYEVIPMNEGVLIRFDVPLESKFAVDPANFSAERWNYQRTANYGSPHFKLDGSKGQDAITASSAYLSKDGRSVFVGLADMRPVMQMRLGWSLATATGTRFEQNTYFTPRELVRFDPAKEGFAPLTVDLTPRRTLPTATNTPVTAAEGQRVASLMGCVACHSIDGSTLGKVGPTWKGLFSSERKLADGSKTKADEAYLRESIREPALRVVAGFDKSDTGMPSYEGVISDAQIEALVLYIRSLH